MKRILFAVAMVGAFVFSGCSASPEDACNSLSECVAKVNPENKMTDADINECVTELKNLSPCSDDNKQEIYDCLADMKCETSMGAAGEAFTCMSNCQAAMGLGSDTATTN